MDFVAKVMHATQLAVTWHDGQKRKISDVPYVVHPLRVAEIVASVELPDGVSREECVLAAVLHDTLEDTRLEPETILRDFGKGVYNIVLELTLDLGIPRALRIQKMIDRVPKMSAAAKVVKLADRLDNMRDMEGRDHVFIQRYCREARAILDAMRGACPPLESEIEKILEKHDAGAAV